MAENNKYGVFGPYALTGEGMCDNCRPERNPGAFSYQFECLRDQYRCPAEDQEPIICELCLREALAFIDAEKAKGGGGE